MTPTDPQRTPAPAPTSAGHDGRLRRWTRAALSPFWVVPSLWCVGAVLAGLLVPELEKANPRWMPLLFQGGSSGARSLLSTIAGAMISVTGLVFSITIVVLQLASSQFSPRVLRTFLDDRVPQNALGVFAASFLYSLTVLRSVIDGDSASTGTVPQLAITIAFLLVLGSVAMFLWFIHHITSSISVGTVITEIAGETRSVMRRSAERRTELSDQPPDLEPLGAQLVVCAVRSGILDVVDHVTLRRSAEEYDVRIEVLHRLGTFVPEGAPLALVHGVGSTGDASTGVGHAGAEIDDWESVIDRGLDLAPERSLQQDLAYGLRQLVDVAERALSPGINDPTTAVQVIDQLHDLLRRLGSEPDPYSVEHDEDGVARVVTSEWTYQDLMDLAVDEIAHWGADGIQVPARLDAMFADLLDGVHVRFRDVVQRKRDEVQRTVSKAKARA